MATSLSSTKGNACGKNGGREGGREGGKEDITQAFISLVDAFLFFSLLPLPPFLPPSPSYDRVYIGADCPESLKEKLLPLLLPGGGVLVGPMVSPSLPPSLPPSFPAGLFLVEEKKRGGK